MAEATDWFEGGGTGDPVDVHELVGVDGPWKAMLDIVQAGALLSVGTTSDGGALAVTVTANGRWRREYFRAADELLAWLAEAVAAVADLPRDRPSAATGNGSRRPARR